MKDFLALFLGGLLLIFAQVVPWHHAVPFAIGSNFSFALVIFLALYRPSAGSWLLVFLLGCVLGALSGAPAGLLPLINLVTFFFVRIACGYIVFERLSSQVILFFALSLSFDLFLLTLTKVVLLCPLGLILKTVFAQSFLLTTLSVPFFALLNKRGGTKGLVLK
jgi:hypothetical protein